MFCTIFAWKNLGRLSANISWKYTQIVSSKNRAQHCFKNEWNLINNWILRHTNNTHTFLHFSSVMVLTRLTFLAKKVLVFLPGSWAWKNSPCTDLLVCHTGVKFLLKEQSNFYSQCSKIISEIISLHCAHPVRHAAIIFESINRHAYRIGNTSTIRTSTFLMSHFNYFSV